MSTYLQLVNKLRSRFNEVNLSASTWSSVVGFDAYTKDTINYAYHDICNAEMEWPFLHNECTFQVTPGTRTYTPTITSGTGQNTDIKEIDWDSFFINTTDDNPLSTYTTSIPATAPYEIDISDDTNGNEWYKDVSVSFYPSLTALTASSNDPSDNQYCIFTRGKYRFNSADAGLTVIIIYRKASDADSANIVKRSQLTYIDYDLWRSTLQFNDYSLPASTTVPQFIYKTQSQGQIGISPIPDSFYDVSFECWIDADDVSASTATLLLPTRFEQVLLDGASSYCYGFREDQPMAKEYSDRFLRGVSRMRTELINRDSRMRTGVSWRRGTLINNTRGSF